MRYIRMLALLVLPSMVLSGCQSSSLPIGTFVNQSDPNQVLELRLDPSQTPNVFIRIAIESGTNKYFGKSVGTYTLNNNHDSSKGRFVFTKSLRDGSLREVWFTAENGNVWKLTVQFDGSFLDSRGVSWKHRAGGDRTDERATHYGLPMMMNEG